LIQFALKLVDDNDIFYHISPTQVPTLLTELLQRYVPLAITIDTEKARSEFIIAPIWLSLNYNLKIR